MLSIHISLKIWKRCPLSVNFSWINSPKTDCLILVYSFETKKGIFYKGIIRIYYSVYRLTCNLTPQLAGFCLPYPTIINTFFWGLWGRIFGSNRCNGPQEQQKLGRILLINLFFKTSQLILCLATVYITLIEKNFFPCLYEIITVILT